MNHRMFAKPGQIDGRLSNVERADLFTPLDFVRRGIDQVVRDAGRTDRVHFDVERPAFVRQRLGQRHDAVLGGAVGPRSRPGLHAGHARHVDDEPAALFLHLCESGSAAEERAVEIRLHHLVE